MIPYFFIFAHIFIYGALIGKYYKKNTLYKINVIGAFLCSAISFGFEDVTAVSECFNLNLLSSSALILAGILAIWLYVIRE